jgi:hypothetical protein
MPGPPLDKEKLADPTRDHPASFPTVRHRFGGISEAERSAEWNQLVVCNEPRGNQIPCRWTCVRPESAISADAWWVSWR